MRNTTFGGRSKFVFPLCSDCGTQQVRFGWAHGPFRGSSPAWNENRSPTTTRRRFTSPCQSSPFNTPQRPSRLFIVRTLVAQAFIDPSLLRVILLSPPPRRCAIYAPASPQSQPSRSPDAKQPLVDVTAASRNHIRSAVSWTCSLAVALGPFTHGSHPTDHPR
jgi:hypothetical protein